NRNRHSKLPDRPVDRELLVLRVEGLDGKPIAHAVNFAAHAVMQNEKVLKYSADYPGAMAGLVERETGVPCLFLQGAAGDLSPNPADWQRGPQAFGEQLGKEVLTLIQAVRCADESAALSVREDDFTFGSRFDLGNPVTRGVFVAAFFRDLVEFY